jgi:hypothetical protein
MENDQGALAECSLQKNKMVKLPTGRKALSATAKEVGVSSALKMLYGFFKNIKRSFKNMK